MIKNAHWYSTPFSDRLVVLIPVFFIMIYLTNDISIHTSDQLPLLILTQISLRHTLAKIIPVVGMCISMDYVLFLSIKDKAITLRVLLTSAISLIIIYMINIIVKYMTIGHLQYIPLIYVILALSTIFPRLILDMYHGNLLCYSHKS